MPSRTETNSAALLFGAAVIAPKFSGPSYVIQGALTANDLRRKLQR